MTNQQTNIVHFFKLIYIYMYIDAVTKYINVNKVYNLTGLFLK